MEKNKIRVINPHYFDYYKLNDGDTIFIDDEKRIVNYIDETHFYLSVNEKMKNAWHICEFAEKMQMNERVVGPEKNLVSIYLKTRPDFRDFKKDDFNMYDYKLVYTYELESNLDVLDQVYFKFNDGNKPQDYHERSLSVGDIVGIHTKYGSYYHYVSSIGFKNITTEAVESLKNFRW